jgi:hypothetical protein
LWFCHFFGRCSQSTAACFRHTNLKHMEQKYYAFMSYPGHSFHICCFSALYLSQLPFLSLGYPKSNFQRGMLLKAAWESIWSQGCQGQTVKEVPFYNFRMQWLNTHSACYKMASTRRFCILVLHKHFVCCISCTFGHFIEGYVRLPEISCTLVSVIECDTLLKEVESYQGHHSSMSIPPITHWSLICILPSAGECGTEVGWGIMVQARKSQVWFPMKAWVFSVRLSLPAALWLSLWFSGG